MARAAGAGLWIQDRAGTQYFMSGSIGAEAELEQHILSLRKNPVDAVLPHYKQLMSMTTPDGAPDMAARQMAEDMTKIAVNQLCKSPKELRVPPEDQLLFLRSKEGRIWFLHKQLVIGAKEKNLPPPDITKAKEIYELEDEKGRKAGEEERMKRLQEQVSGTDLLSGLSSPLAETSFGAKRGSNSPSEAQMKTHPAKTHDMAQTVSVVQLPGN